MSLPILYHMRNTDYRYVMLAVPISCTPYYQLHEHDGTGWHIVNGGRLYDKQEVESLRQGRGYEKVDKLSALLKFNIISE